MLCEVNLTTQFLPRFSPQLFQRFARGFARNKYEVYLASNFGETEEVFQICFYVMKMFYCQSSKQIVGMGTE